MAERCPWQQKALFLNGNLAEKRRAERLGMMAHLLLAHSAQSLPLAQPDPHSPSAPCQPAPSWLLPWAPAAGRVPAVLASFTTSLNFPITQPLASQHPFCLPSCSPALGLRISPSLAAASSPGCPMPLFPPARDCPTSCALSASSWGKTLLHQASPNCLLCLQLGPALVFSTRISSSSASPPSLKANRTLA